MGGMCIYFLILKGIHSTLAHNGPRMALDLEKQFFFVLVLLKAFIKIKQAHTQAHTHALTNALTNTILFKNSFIDLGLFCFLHQINRTMSH